MPSNRADEFEEASLSIESILKPLFEEPSLDYERENPWSGPKAFAIGGMALPTRYELGQQYFRAANCLIESIRRGTIEDYKLVNPVLFLYRHSIELTVKGMMRDATGHSLNSLADAFKLVVKDRCGRVVPEWVITRIKEIAAIDPNSTAFRYAENWDKTLKCNVPVDGELYVGLDHLQRSMEILNRELLSLSGALIFGEMK